MLYFAYGSNMHWPQMKERCPSASFIGRALLKDYTLKFTRKSSSRDCGVADIVSDEKGIVWGILYHIDEIDLGRLDQSEGYNPNRTKNAYVRHEVLVLFEGDKDRPITATTYTVQHKATSHIPPNSKYYALLLQGADFWQLRPEYIEMLRRIEVYK